MLFCCITMFHHDVILWSNTGNLSLYSSCDFSGVGSTLYEELSCHHLSYLFSNHNPSPHSGSITSPALDRPTAVTSNWEWDKR